ncbi:MAG: hypothetical protein C4291_09020 [Candidatus Dadabacteria bacterium]
MKLKRISTILPILLFSALFGFFLWEIYVAYNNSGYRADWHGWWITSSKLEGDVFYFRKKFNLSNNIKNAWLLVSASDELKVYLNGKNLGQANLDGWFPIGVYDVTDTINLGVNVLAVRVDKRSFQGPVKAVVELGYEDIYGNKHYVFSDETWKLSNREERSSPSGLYWYNLGFNDSSWVNAETLGRPRDLWLNVDPRIYTTSANGLWFWAGNQREISCRTDIDTSKKPETAWIRLASKGGFILSVNGMRVDVRESVIGTEAETVTIPSNILRIYDIGPFLRNGNNIILVTVYAEGLDRGLYMDGIIEGDGWNKKIDETGFKCFYSGGSISLPIYKGDPGWVSIKNKSVLDAYIPLGLDVLLYSILIFIFCISSVVFIGFTFVISAIIRLPFHYLSKTYFIPSLFLLFIYILRYDVRFYESFPFQSRFLILSLCLLFLIWLLNPLIDRIRVRELPKRMPVIVFISILLIGAFLRFKGISIESLHPDEAGFVVKAQGVLDYGYPSIKLAPELPAWYVSTSELVSYLQALSFIVLGKTEFALRLQMVLFDVSTIALLYYFGKMIGGTRVGLLSSAVYSLLPSAIGMSNFGRYPSQLAFFGFLTGFLAFIYLRTYKLRYLCLCALSFLLTYFSWQGSALMILPLFFACIVTWKNERILKDIVLFLSIVVPVVATHLSIRFLEQILIPGYFFGPSVSSLTPEPMILSPAYDPFYYIPNFFFIESHQFISILFFAGIPLVSIKYKTYKNLLFLYPIPLLTPFVMSNLLEISDYRYAYYLLPYLVLCACGFFFVFLDYLGCNKEGRSISFINYIFASIMLVVVSSNLFLNLKNFPNITDGLKSDPSLRYFPETEKLVRFMKANMEPGDIVVSYQPHLLEYYFNKTGYSGKADYFFESRLLLPVVILQRNSTFIPIHRISGNRAILSLNELKRIIGAGKGKIWIVATPDVSGMLDEDSQEFMKGTLVVFERYKATVYLIGGG